MPRDRPLVAAARLELRTTGVSHVRVLTLGRPEHTMTAAGNLNAPFHGRCLAFRDRVLGGTRGGTQRGRSSELSVLHFRWTALRLGGWVAGRAGLRRVRSACSCRQSCLVCGGPNGSTVLEPDVQPLSRGSTVRVGSKAGQVLQELLRCVTSTDSPGNRMWQPRLGRTDSAVTA